MPMIPLHERQYIYDGIFSFLLDIDTPVISTPLRYICDKLNIELMPLSRIISETQLSGQEIFRVWSNKDGYLYKHQANGVYSFKIAYNDVTNSKERQNFTIAEELSHYILGHYLNYNRNILHLNALEEADVKKYRYIEECARMAGGILVCPPPVYYVLDDEYTLSKQDTAKIFNISVSCAGVRMSILKKYEKEIKDTPRYNELLKHYDGVEFDYPCNGCGEKSLSLYEIRNITLCEHCGEALFEEWYNDVFLNK